MIAWVLPKGVTLAGIASGKPNHVATIHLLKAASKSTRLDAAPVRRRSAVRGDSVVDVKPGDAVLSVVMGWEVENFVAVSENKETKRAPTTPSSKGKKKPAARKPAATSSPQGKKAKTTKSTAKKATYTSSTDGKKPAAATSTKGKKPATKTKPATKSKPAATSPTKGKKPATKAKPAAKKTTSRKKTKK